jgi:hypothetical protein
MTPNFELLTRLQSHLWEQVVVPVFKGTRAYMVGGTALMLFYYQHRLSDDFDFQTTPEDQPYFPMVGARIRSLAEAAGVVPLSSTPKPWVGWEIVEFGGGVKIDLAVDSIGCREVNTFDGIQVASVDDICRMKWAAVAGRIKSRDTFDLMTMQQHEVPIFDRLEECRQDIDGDTEFLDSIVQNLAEIAAIVETEEGPSWALPGYNRAVHMAFVLQTAEAILRKIQDANHEI